MDRDAIDGLQLRLTVGAHLDNPVIRAGLHAMRGRQHDFWRDQRAGAKIAARADDGDNGAADAFAGRRAAADDGMRWKGAEQRKEGNAERHRFIGTKQ